MRFRHFLVTGVEVLQVGGQRCESNVWPASHWRENKGRLRLHMPAIDDRVSASLRGRRYGGAVEGIVVALEVSDFAAWPVTTFARPDATPSFKPKYKDLWCFARLDWPRIKDLTLRGQYAAYTQAVLHAVGRLHGSSRKPRGFEVDRFLADLDTTLKGLKPSTLTRAAANVDGGG